MAMSPAEQIEAVRALVRSGQLEEALEQIDCLLDEAPDLAEAHYQHAVVVAAMKRDAGEVEDSLVMALHYDPGHEAAAIALSGNLERRGDLEGSTEILRSALHRNPTGALWLALGRNMRDCGRGAEAVEAFRVAFGHFPGDVSVAAMLGLALFEAGSLSEAESTLRQAVQSDPRGVEALHNLALVRYHSADLDEARLLAERVLELRAASAPTLSLLGHVERDSGRISEALARYDESLRLKEGFGDAMINRCYALLLDARYEQGWREYAKRFTLDEFPPRGLPFPEWNGEDPRGHRLLVYAEQGLGDEIMFASCLPDLEARGARITLECSARLAPLMARSFPGIDVHGMAKSEAPRWAASLKAIRWQVAVGDLPRFFRNRGDEFPSTGIGYLRADPELRGQYRRRIESLAAGRRVVALSWRGGDWRSGRVRRSLSPEALEMLVSGSPVLWISLQHGDVDAEIQSLRALGADVVHWPEAVASLDEMAALLLSVDEILCVDNTVTHLSGALGCPARVLLSAAPEWRYGLRGARMPWYPGVRLYRQERLGDWSQVVQMLRRDIGLAPGGVSESDSD